MKITRTKKQKPPASESESISVEWTTIIGLCTTSSAEEIEKFVRPRYSSRRKSVHTDVLVQR